MGKLDRYKKIKELVSLPISKEAEDLTKKEKIDIHNNILDALWSKSYNDEDILIISYILRSFMSLFDDFAIRRDCCITDKHIKGCELVLNNLKDKKITGDDSGLFHRLYFYQINKDKNKN